MGSLAPKKTYFDPADRDRLIRLLGMLGSDHLGERAAAGLMASRMLRERGVSWDDLVGVPSPATSMSSVPQRRGAGWRATLAACRAAPESLSDWETDFLSDLVRFRQPTRKQLQVLGRIGRRLGVYPGARP